MDYSQQPTTLLEGVARLGMNWWSQASRVVEGLPAALSSAQQHEPCSPQTQQLGQKLAAVTIEKAKLQADLEHSQKQIVLLALVIGSQHSNLATANHFVAALQEDARRQQLEFAEYRLQHDEQYQSLNTQLNDAQELLNKAKAEHAKSLAGQQELVLDLKIKIGKLEAQVEDMRAYQQQQLNDSTGLFTANDLGILLDDTEEKLLKAKSELDRHKALSKQEVSQMIKELDGYKADHTVMLKEVLGVRSDYADLQKTSAAQQQELHRCKEELAQAEQLLKEHRDMIEEMDASRVRDNKEFNELLEDLRTWEKIAIQRENQALMWQGQAEALGQEAAEAHAFANRLLAEKIVLERTLAAKCLRLQAANFQLSDQLDANSNSAILTVLKLTMEVQQLKLKQVSSCDAQPTATCALSPIGGVTKLQPGFEVSPFEESHTSITTQGSKSDADWKIPAPVPLPEDEFLMSDSAESATVQPMLPIGSAESASEQALLPLASFNSMTEQVLLSVSSAESAVMQPPMFVDNAEPAADQPTMSVGSADQQLQQ